MELLQCLAVARADLLQRWLVELSADACGLQSASLACASHLSLAGQLSLICPENYVAGCTRAAVNRAILPVLQKLKDTLTATNLGMQMASCT